MIGSENRFFFEPHGLDDGSVPRLSMRPITTPFVPVTLSSASVLSSGVGSFSHARIKGTMATSCEETEDTADVASELAYVVVAGARVIGPVSDAPVIISLVTVVPDSTMTEGMTPMTPPAMDDEFPFLFPVPFPVPAEGLGTAVKELEGVVLVPLGDK